MEEQDTKKKILDVAEHLFAENGISATSLRRVTSGAGTNLASIHYHFGSKEALIKAVYLRRMEPINRERERLLAGVDYTENTEKVLEDVLRSFIEPMLIVHISINEEQRAFIKLFEKAQSESNEIKNLIITNFEKTNKKFFKIFKKILPELPETDLIWRFKFIIGVVLASARPYPNSGPFAIKKLVNLDVDFHLNRIIPFLIAGFQAPTAVPDKRRKK